MNAAASSMLVGGGQRQKANPYGVRAGAVVRCALDDIPALRQQLGPPGDKPFQASFLKPSDEQSVVAVAAVLQAINQHGLEWNSFADWGVIAAPRFLGRLNCAENLYKFEVGGAGKAPPLFVAHRSLHAVSGTISLALQSKGPNFGVGGGSTAPAEGLLTALTMLEEYRLPGLWLVLTQCDPEPRPDYTGVNAIPAVCHALALAFTQVADDWSGPRLRLFESGAGNLDRAFAPDRDTERAAVFTSLARYVERGRAGTRWGTWSCPLKWGCELRLTDET